MTTRIPAIPAVACNRTPIFNAVRHELRLLGLAGLAIGAQLFLSGGAAAAVDPCGAPALMKESVAATLVWKDCATGQWSLRVTGGGSASTLSYEGKLSADRPATSVVASSIESSDLLNTSNPADIQFALLVAGSGQDGFDFTHPSGAKVCVDLTAPGKQVLIGAARSPVTSPVDLATLASCGAPAVTCGTLSYTRASERGSFLWQDCDTGLWHLRVTAAGSNLSYKGSLVSPQALGSLATYSYESNDTLATPSAGRVDYGMAVNGTGEDGLDFALAQGASACLDAGGPVLVGPARQSVQSPFDLTTLKTCSIAPPPPPPPAKHVYLEDADTADSATEWSGTDAGDRPFPRITTGPLKLSGTAEQFSKYGAIDVKSARFSWLKTVQDANPDVLGFRIHCPQEYQGWNDQACRTGSGIPFDGTAAATADCNMYAGHWLYAPGSPLSAAITASATSLKVADASRFTVNRYIVIYDGGAGAFQNAEHALVSALNTSTNTLTLAARGYKSTARAHSAGAIVAEHALGNGTGDGWEKNWAYNLSTASPRDSSGRQMNEVMADWLEANYNRDGQGAISPVKLTGIVFDVDFHFVMDGGLGRRPDVNNDLVQDNGLAANGDNLWGQGLDDLYSMVRERLPHLVVVGGVIESRGYDFLNGIQLEGWPNRNVGSSAPDYRGFDGRLATYSAQIHHGTYGPRYVEAINRVSTKLYPYSGATVADNAPFRFAFGTALLDDAWFGQQNAETTDPWWDEYAVDTVTGSATYGRAIDSSPTNESAIRSHAGWLGFPQGPRSRVYDLATFAPEKSLIADGGFESGTSGWSGNNLSLSRDATQRLEGSASLKAGPMQTYRETETGAYAAGPTLSLKANTQYTLAFGARSSTVRTIQVAMGSQTAQLTVPETWSRQIFTFTTTNAGSYQLRFNLGRESSEVWVDGLYLFEGNADIFRRDFDHGIVVVNATPTARTVALGGTFQRIRGTGQDPLNDGASLTQVTIAPYDSAILVRPQ
jgi:hypothetical protein